jgi:hypothetical protein
MGKIVATYALKVTLREPDEPAEDRNTFPLTNAALIEVVQVATEKAIADNGGQLVVNATSERTDK